MREIVSHPTSVPPHTPVLSVVGLTPVNPTVTGSRAPVPRTPGGATSTSGRNPLGQLQPAFLDLLTLDAERP
jgi:hypothetical protein